MRFMVFMMPGQTSDYEAGAMPDDELLGRMMAFNEELGNAGIVLGLDGFHPTSKGARVRFSGGDVKVEDGPFANVQNLVGGYWLWKVASREEALAWAKRCPASPGDTLEIRQVFDPEDFGAETNAKIGELRDRVAARVSANNGET